jgi:hypothetical protein
MQPIDKSWLDIFPKEFHNRLIRDDKGEYWISCQWRSELVKGNDTYYPMNVLVILDSFSIAPDGTVIYEN